MTINEDLTETPRARGERLQTRGPDDLSAALAGAGWKQFAVDGGPDDDVAPMTYYRNRGGRVLGLWIMPLETFIYFIPDHETYVRFRSNIRAHAVCCALNHGRAPQGH